jgi:hypothetical protein
VLPVVLAIALGAAWYFVVLQPRLRFSNRLVAPVRLAVGEGTSRTVAPGATVTVRVPRGRTLVAEWEMIRPLSADSQPMGEPVKGAVVVRQVRGTLHGEARPRTGEADFFAPLISNGGTEPIGERRTPGRGGLRLRGPARRHPGVRGLLPAISEQLGPGAWGDHPARGHVP